MAKSKSFFGLRRGSTKSLTFQVLNGQQITKDRVTEVKNPKTNGQIMQRMKMAAATNIYRYFKTYIDRGQQGVAYGTKSRQEWLKQVLAGNALYAPKGTSILMPWTFPITKGSLSPFTYNSAGESNIKIGTEGEEGNITLVTNDATLLESNKQLQNGDQITVICMSKATNGTYNLYQASKIIGDGTDIYDVMQENGIDITDLTVAGETFAVFQALSGIVAGCAIILSRLNGAAYERSSQNFVGDESVFTDAFRQLATDSYRDKAQITRDWPEVVESGFIPFGTTSVYVTKQGTGYAALAVYGFTGNEYRLYGVTSNGGSEDPLYQVNKTIGNIAPDDAKVGYGANAIDAGDYFTGYISISDYEKLY